LIADPDHGLMVVAVSQHARLQASAGRIGQPAREHHPSDRDEQHDHDGAADELGQGKLPADQHDQHDSELDDQVGRADHEHHGGDEVGPFLEQRLGHCGRRVGA
jgi:hypothetical protein